MERRTIRGVHVIRVRGDSVERARQHGALLREEIQRGALPYLAKKNEGIIRRGPGLARIQMIQDMAAWFYRNVIIKYVEFRTPDEIKRVMRAMSESTGIAYRDVVQGVFQADGFMLLCRLSVMRHTLGEIHAGGLPGCTSAVALKGWTASGRLLACRNQDYPMVGPWEQNTTVIFHEPTEPGHIPHVAVTTAGVHTAGLTAMNQEGITLFTHAHFGRHVTLHGMPVVDIGNEIVRRAKTLGQAVDIVRQCRPYANWAFVVASAYENDAAVLEITPDKVAITSAKDGFLAHSNYFHSPELRQEEALISGGYVEDLGARVCRIREVIEAHRGTLEPEHLSAVLGDQIDWCTGEERVVGNTVGVVTTIKSTVWDPEAQKLWVSARQQSPTGLGDYIEIDGNQFWAIPEGELDEAHWPTLPGYQPKHPELIGAMEHYRNAYQAHHMEGVSPENERRTLESLRLAAETMPSDGNLWMQTAIVAFGQHKFEEAKKHFERARTLKLSPHTAGVCELYLARSLDLAGDREGALKLYRPGASHRDPGLQEAMKRGLKRPYRAEETVQMMIDLQFPDTFHY
ncbi:C45 family autoproteolytic acyltransferase/hydrolase [Bdellovibrionota bacterium FG-1]